MRNHFIGWLVLVAALGAASCGSKGAPRAEHTATAEAAQGGGHLAAGVVPGSHEDWCDEHQVAETQCTRCDPSLIAAFQATRDWDAAHGLPKSQCTICDPTLEIVRPPKAEAQ